MKRVRFFLSSLSVVVFTLAMASLAQGQATRTWVSGVGDDVNPCSRTAPCKTFAGAISKTAAGGEISALDPAGFGTITITKSITINGDGTLAGILAAGTTGIIVNAGVNDNVVIRNLSINGAGTGTFGIRYLAGGSLTVENVTISGFTNHGIHMALTGAVTGRLFVKDSVIRTGNTTVSRGINIQPVSGSPQAFALIHNTRLEKMFVGLYVGEGGRATMSNSTATLNSYCGVVTEAASGNAQTNLESCVISLNGSGVQGGAGATITRLSNVAICNNFGGGLTGAGNFISFGNNKVFGNAPDNASTGPFTTQPQL